MKKYQWIKWLVASWLVLVSANGLAAAVQAGSCSLKPGHVQEYIINADLTTQSLTPFGWSLESGNRQGRPYLRNVLVGPPGSTPLVTCTEDGRYRIKIHFATAPIMKLDGVNSHFATNETDFYFTIANVIAQYAELTQQEMTYPPSAGELNYFKDQEISLGSAVGLTSGPYALTLHQVPGALAMTDSYLIKVDIPLLTFTFVDLESGEEMDLFKFKFQFGDTQVYAGTCNISSETVLLGRQQITDLPSSPVSFSIKLRDCPPMYPRLANNTGISTSQSHALNIFMQAAHGAFNVSGDSGNHSGSNRSYLLLDSKTKNGLPPAQGVGVVIAQNGNPIQFISNNSLPISDSAKQAAVANGQEAWHGILARVDDGRKTIDIPMTARYERLPDGSPLKPGHGDSEVYFTIIYY